MAQNTSEDKAIADLDSREITKPYESVELTPVGAIDDFLKPYFNRRDQLQKPSTGADEYDYSGFLGERGKIYEEALETARLLKDTRSEAGRQDNFGKMEGTLVGAVKKDFETYPKGRPQCGRMECWAARLELVNIVVALVRSERADDPESPTRMSKGLLALAIAAENNNFTMVDALKDIAVADGSFVSSEPDFSSPDVWKLNWFYSMCSTPVYELYPLHEVWLCPIEAAARLGLVGMVCKLIELRTAKMESIFSTAKKDKFFSAMMRYEKNKYRRAFDWAVKMGHCRVVKSLIDEDYVFGLYEPSNVRGLLDEVDVESYGRSHTPLALAVLSGQKDVVQLFIDTTVVARNRKGIVLLHMAYEEALQRRTGGSSEPDNRSEPLRGRLLKSTMDSLDIDRALSRLTEERKVHVDAVNAILVGTALIATATFAGWLSPPLGYSSPSGADGPFASVEGHPILEKFWVFNSLSFFFSIATFMVGANVALPPPKYIYIGDVVQSLRWKLRLAYCLVSAAVFFVMGAFACAGFAVLPPITKYTVNMALTVGIGVTVVAVVVLSTFFGHMFTAFFVSVVVYVFRPIYVVWRTGWRNFKEK